MAEKFKFKPSDPKTLADSCDVVIIGSGGAGLVSALQARELGLRPIVLEKMPIVGGNTLRASSGMNAAETNVQLRHGIVDSFSEFYQETYQGGGRLNDPKLLSYFTTHSGQAIDWLHWHGIKLNDLTITGGMSKKRAHRPQSTAPVGAFLINNLLWLLAQVEVPIFTNAKVEKLLKSEEGKIRGVEVDLAGQKQTIVTDAVILATGGFGASKELMKRYRPDLLSYKTTNQNGATGDGIKLATQLGAQAIQMEMVQIHPTVQQDTDHTYLIGEAVRGEGAILVDHSGVRFTDELGTRKVVANKITDLPQKSAYLIFDEGVKQRVKALDFYLQKGLVLQAESIAELATKLNMEQTTLHDTLLRWNTAVETKKDVQFGRHTGMQRKLIQAPFYAIHIAPAIHYTMGGLHIDEKTRVLDENGEIIPGLFAAGEVAGGLHGNNRIGGNSIAETVVFGRQAGQQVAQYLE
ncbi:flavocytochrome c [Ligilactobacillus apodemi]|uniref:Fumarate reductase flavoprotein subunit n=1 Tax=Ligilactobacillus apodemi DSM 16634 = JCM 16172 TaxID=1423724 RepID=A0A0R1TUD8_9LACO|nr:flavocytochrome c [Ligilactobacillus apodemi]KRL84876.1 fumarate reductase flavoprotein subunit [Ligilactobacillus apodemi DSM 16634 = JCM 16172]MCR1901023.1 flavocytochrome c [Ligilactobacillus apodemi]